MIPILKVSDRRFGIRCDEAGGGLPSKVDVSHMQSSGGIDTETNGVSQAVSYELKDTESGGMFHSRNR